MLLDLRSLWEAEPTAYTLATETGTFVLSGQGATLLHGYCLPSETGVFTLEGNDANLVYTPFTATYTLHAEAGTFALSGIPADTFRGYLLAASFAEFVTTGRSAEGVETLEGGGGGISWDAFIPKKFRPQPTPLVRHYTMPIESASFTTAAAPVTLLRSYVLSGDVVRIEHTGVAAVGLRSYRAAPWTAPFRVKGKDARLIAARVGVCETGAYQITANDAQLAFDRSELIRLVVAEDDEWLLLNAA